MGALGDALRWAARLQISFQSAHGPAVRDAAAKGDACRMALEANRFQQRDDRASRCSRRSC
jgi:hypothetical protein